MCYSWILKEVAKKNKQKTQVVIFLNIRRWPNSEGTLPPEHELATGSPEKGVMGTSSCPSRI